MKYLLSLIILLQADITWAQQAPQLVVPIGHTKGITSVDISPDGKYLLTGSMDESVKIWNWSGHELLSLEEHQGNVLAVAFSPRVADDPNGGKYILTGSSDCTAILWDKEGNKKAIVQHAGFEASFKLPYVTSVAFSPDGREIMTGSQDSTARIWSTTGTPIKTLPHSDMVQSVAFSPKGNSILTGCKNNTAVLWDRNGTKKATFTGHSGSVKSAVFSPGGDSILTGSADGTAILWDLSGKKLNTFKHSGNIKSVDFSPDGQQIITADWDGTIKVWLVSGKEIRTIKAFERGMGAVKISPDGKFMVTASDVNVLAKIFHIDGIPYQSLKGYASAINNLAIAPDGTSLLTGHADSTAKLWELPQQKIHTFKYPDKLASVAFSPKSTGDSLGGTFILIGCEDGNTRLQDRSGQTKTTFKDANRAVFSKNGGTILTGNNNIGNTKLWSLVNNAFSPVPHSEIVTALDCSPNGKSFAIGSYNGVVIYWDSTGKEPVKFNVSSTSTINSIDFSPDGNFIVTGSKNGLTEVRDLSGKLIVKNEKAIRSVKHVAFSPKNPDDPQGGKYVLRGCGDNNTELWNLTNNTVKTFSGHSSTVNAVAFSEDGNVIYTGSKDGTIKIWSTVSGQEIATLVSIGTEDWVVTSPSGLFDATPGAMNLMYYVVNREVVALGQLKERYYEPGLFQKLTGVSKEPIRNVSTLKNLPLYPEIEASINENQLNITLKVREGGMGILSMFVNGKEVAENINPEKKTALTIDLVPYREFCLPLSNTIALRAFNSDGWLKSPAYELKYGSKTSAKGGGDDTDNDVPRITLSSNPGLYIISIGTSNYSGNALDLAFPDLDAKAIAEALQAAGSKLFQDRVYTRLLTTSTKNAADIANKTNIEAAFNEYVKTRPNDILVVYFSGHGVTWGTSEEKAQFYYLTKDIASEELSDPEIRKNYTVSSEDLTRWLTKIKAKKQVMILDACNSGKVVEAITGARDLNPSQIRALDRMKDRTGMYILTGAASGKKSYEASQYGQGLLTYSILEGMTLAENGIVDVMALFQHCRNKVPDLAKGINEIQVPMLAFPDGGESFDIGIVDETVKIPLASIKPVFIMNSFFDEDNDDKLGLAKAIKSKMEMFAVDGAQAEIIYYDKPEYVDGYSIRGNYDTSKDPVEVKCSLFKGKVLQGKFTVSSKKNNVSELPDKILEEALKLVK